MHPVNPENRRELTFSYRYCYFLKSFQKHILQTSNKICSFVYVFTTLTTNLYRHKQRPQH
jgi:gluconate kinase